MQLRTSLLMLFYYDSHHFIAVDRRSCKRLISINTCGLNSNPNSIHTWKEFNRYRRSQNLADQFVTTDVIPDLRYFLNPLNKTEASSMAPGHDTGGLNSNPNSIHTWKEFNHCRHSLNLADQFLATDVIPDPHCFLNPLNKTEASSIAPGHDTGGERHTFRRVIKMGKAACIPHPVFAINIPQHTGRRDRTAYCSCVHVLGLI
ncbi:hypothetical protein CEXT_383551 [Caerostris extrusa]|uniref:Uncharacterized protein n=1 Tax=Caerostris extrusa TaxID=172846 RepID=A0AAV4SU04_CAEEX|nr:hypothetical protein CEXT_383551 [Caerostris extrusa]